MDVYGDENKTPGQTRGDEQTRASNGDGEREANGADSAKAYIDALIVVPVATVEYYRARKAAAKKLGIGVRDIEKLANERRRASAEGTETGALIRIQAGQLALTADAAEIALRGARVPFYQRAGVLVRPVTEKVEAAAPNVEELDWPELEIDEFADPLYDSRRSYVDQVTRYKSHQGKPTARRRRGSGRGAP